MLQPGEQVPHFEVIDIGGRRVHYRSLWQHRSLVLISLPSDDPSSGRDYATAIASRRAEFERCGAVCIVTREAVSGLPVPGALVADRWGEIVFIAQADNVPPLPAVDALLAWVEHLQQRCPECEGEAK